MSSRKHYINTVIEEEKFFKLLSFLVAIFVLFQILSLLDNGGLVLLLLFIVAIFASLLVSDIDPLTLMFPLTILQLAYPQGLNTKIFRNWIQGNILPVSLVYILALFISILLVARVIRSKSIKLPTVGIGLILVLVSSTIVSDLSDIRWFIYDASILLAIIVFSIYILNSEIDYERFLLIYVTVPVAVSLGNGLLIIASELIGSQVYSGYIVMSLYIHGVFLAVLSEWKILPNRILYTYIFGYSFFFITIFTDYTSSYHFIWIFVGVSLLLLRCTRHNLLGKKEVSTLSIVVLVMFCYSSYILLTNSPSPINRFLFQMRSLLTMDLTKISHTISVRIIEIGNIIGLGIQNPLRLMFGQGLGEYFTDTYIPFEQYTQIGESDYTEQSIRDREFYRPHNSPAYVLLKYGIFGVLVIANITYISIKYILNEMSEVKIPALVLVFMLGWVLGWQFKNALLIGVTIGLLFLSEDVKK